MGREGYHSALPLARTQAGGRGANLKGTTMRVVYSGVLAAVFSMSAAVAGDGAAPTTAGTSAMNDNALKADNPFARPSTLPYELPPFDRIHDGDYLPAFHAGMREQLKEVERIAHNREPPTFENTLVALERAGQLLRRVDATFGRLNACNTNPKLQDIDTEMAPKLTAQEDAIHLNPALWTRVEALYDKRAGLHLDSESQQLLTRYHTEFVRAGARLEPADQTRLRALNTEISTLTTRFKHNVLKATADGAVVVDDVRDLDGLSEGQIGAAAQAAAARGLGGKWVIALQNTTNQPLLAQLKNRALRQRIYEASIGRARGGSSDNTAVIAQLVKLRAERASLLGYPNHAAYQLEDESAGNPAAVRDMISQVAPSALARARGSGRDPEADRRAGRRLRHAVLRAPAVGLVVLLSTGAQGALRLRPGARRALLRARSRARGRGVLRGAPAVRTLLQGAPRPARLPGGRQGVRGLRRRRRAARAVPGRLLRTRQQAGWRVDGFLREPVAAAAPQAGGGEPSEHPQAAAGAAGAAHLRRGHDHVPRVRARAARHALERALPEALRHRGAARLRRVSPPVQRDVGARAGGGGALRPPLSDGRADAARAARESAGGAEVQPGLCHHRIPGRGAPRPGLVPDQRRAGARGGGRAGVRGRRTQG